MPVECTNRCGDTYRLYVGATRTGKRKFFMSKRATAKGAPVEEIPEGFEIRESPADGMVTIRKQRSRLTTPDEQRIVEDAIRRAG